MKNLNAELLKSDFKFPENLEVIASNTLPEKIIQFGEGNFLRGFVDWMIHELNKKNLFNGRIVAIQPTPHGKVVGKINAQDGLYTVILRGVQGGKVSEKREIITSISRGINPYEDWKACLKCAENPEIEYAISNTTEAGLVYHLEEKPTTQAPLSFPAKLTAYLYHRFQTFNGAADKGMIIIPCELLEDNGNLLKKIVLKHSEDWNLPEKFVTWIVEHNQFLNTLVDRVVTGYPKDEIEKITAELGYIDQLLLCGEPFHFWAIEGSQEIAERLPFAKIGLNVAIEEDVTPYRTRKVRILNGAHTASVPAAFLSGLETVGEMMDDECMGKFVRQTIYEEIIPSISLDKKMLTEFADAVVERFLNPFIKHYLLSILLHSSSKFKLRILPSILEYQKIYGKLPERLAFSFAALLTVYKDGKLEGTTMRGKRAKDEFVFTDNAEALAFLIGAWTNFDGTEAAAQNIAATILSNATLWGQDLTKVMGLSEKVGAFLYQITHDGTKATVSHLIGEQK